MSDKEYWRSRSKEYEAAILSKCKSELEPELKKLFRESLSAIEKDIESLYGRYQSATGLSYAEARKILRGAEYSKWRLSLKEYVALSHKDSKILKELQTLAMRSRISRLEKLYSETLIELQKLGEQYEGAVKDFLTTAYKERYYHGIYDLATAGKLEIPATKVQPEKLENVLAIRWAGGNYSSRIWKNTEKLSQVLKTTLSQGLHRGLSVQKLSRELSQEMKVSYKNAERLARTELNFVQNHAAKESLEAAGLAEYEFIAVLDHRTSQRCQALDGTIHLLEEYDVGTNAPPMHPRCRSTISAVVEGGKRTAKTGKNIKVPAEMKYPEFKAVYIDRAATYAEAGIQRDSISVSPVKANAPAKIDSAKFDRLKQKFASQRANGATLAELESILKAAGRLIVGEVKNLSAPQIDIATLQGTRDNFVRRLNSLRGEIPSGEYGELYEIYSKIEQELSGFKNEHEQQNADNVKNLLSQVRAMGAAPERLKRQFRTSNPKAQAVFEKALSHFPADWIDASIKRGTLGAFIDDRGKYRDVISQILTTDDIERQFSAAIHELGHRMERVIPRILETERNFYARRTSGEKIERLIDIFPNFKYNDDEVTRRDKFLHAYMGRDYGGSAYELVSMGFEYAYTNPNFLLMDSDMAEWIYGILALM